VVQRYNLFAAAISCSGYRPKNGSKDVQRQKFQQAFSVEAKKASDPYYNQNFCSFTF